MTKLIATRELKLSDKYIYPCGNETYAIIK